jgi:hypothetical protein
MGDATVKLEDYLIDQTGKNWAEMLSGWAGILPQVFTIWLVNRFGDIFAVFDDDSVHCLDVGGGTLERVADNREAFIALMNDDDQAKGFLMIPFVDECIAAGLILEPNQCYAYRIPPLLGGKYALENFHTIDLAVNYSFLADIWKQTKDLPNRTKVNLVIRR